MIDEKEFKDHMNDLYRRLGGIGTKDGRLLNVIINRMGAAEKRVAMIKSREADIDRAISLIEDAAAHLKDIAPGYLVEE